MNNLPKKLSEQLETICTEKCIPFKAFFELTYRCNLRCRHCYTPMYYDNELSLSEIESILDQLVHIGTFNLIFTGGEILVREDFFDITNIAKSKGFLLVLLTNGTLITNVIADKIARLKPIGVDISLYGACEETHDFVTKVTGSFERAVEGIKLLVERGIRVRTKTVLMSSNADEYKEIVNLSKNLGATSYINVGIVPRKDGSFLPLRHDLSFEDAKDFLIEKGKTTNFPDSRI